MPARPSFDYAIIRAVPRVERQEFVNVGVVLFCLERRFLAARIHIDETRIRALWDGADVATIRRHVEAIPPICMGDPAAGPIALLTLRERFHWLVSPRSTTVQISPVHTGICEDPEIALNQMFARLVLSKAEGGERVETQA